MNDLTSKLVGINNLVFLSWLFIVGMLNLYVGYTSTFKNFFPWAYYTYGIYNIINVCSSILINRKQNNTIKKNGYPRVEFSSTILSRNYKSTKIIARIVSLSFCIILIFQLKGIYNNLWINNNDTLTIKISLQLFGVLFSILIFFNKYIQSIRDSWLKNFEKRIIIEELTSEEIKRIFIDDYIGKTTLNWLKGYSDDVEERLTIFLNSVKELNEKFLDFDLKDFETDDDALTLLELNFDTYEQIINSKKNWKNL
ncbi:hypothetical protein [Ruminiclostridium cellobioparum]|uniref:hypothetical protein n=1 Tax=Ruminiclostridium cellobioparum TaxID=29355 RepID=UPI000593BB9D|nr:hypothetical protein [Ruminiclostridium cellobioparum]